MKHNLQKLPIQSLLIAKIRACCKIALQSSILQQAQLCTIELYAIFPACSTRGW